MKYLILFSIGISITFTSHSQPPIDTVAAKANLDSTATVMLHYFVAKDYTDFIKFTHPSVIKLAGGPANTILALKKAIANADSKGYSFADAKIDSVSNIIVLKNELQAIVPEIIIIKIKGKNGLLAARSYLAAISDDKGKTWLFIDTSGRTLKQMQEFLPTLSNKLVIPKKTDPVFYSTGK